MSPDFKHYGILWMGRKALANSYSMDGAFNDCVLTLAPMPRSTTSWRGSTPSSIRTADSAAYARREQISHRLLNEEFKMLRRSSEIFPTIFICVAAPFERRDEQDHQHAARADRRPQGLRLHEPRVGIHYAKLVVLIISLGLLAGVTAGIWFGKMLGGIYMEVYRFPISFFSPSRGDPVGASSSTIASALAGTCTPSGGPPSSRPPRLCGPSPRASTGSHSSKRSASAGGSASPRGSSPECGTQTCTGRCFRSSASALPAPR